MVNKYLFFIVFATIFFMISLIIMFGNFWNSPPPYEDLISVEGRIFFLDAQTPKSGVPLMIYGHKGQIKLLCWDVEYSDATCFKKDKRNILRGKTALAKYYAAKKLAFIPENRLMELIVDGEILVNYEEKFNIYSIKKIRLSGVMLLLTSLPVLIGAGVLCKINNIK